MQLFVIQLCIPLFLYITYGKTLSFWQARKIESFSQDELLKTEIRQKPNFMDSKSEAEKKV